MRVVSLFIEDIKVGERRREDFGDLEGLAASIAKYGLFHPVIVNGNILVAGERRLRACRDILKWSEMPCRMYEDLAEGERREIELEENIRRKDLTPLEASKRIVQSAENIAPIISSTMKEKDSRGRKAERGAPKKDVSQALGVSEATLIRSEQHVEAVTKYPELSVVPTQTAAIKAARDLDALPEPKRNEVLSKLATEGKTALAEIPRKTTPKTNPTPKPTPASGRHATNLSQIQAFVLTVQSQSPEELTAGWTEKEIFQFLDNLRECRDGLTGVISDLNKYVTELQRQAS